MADVSYFPDEVWYDLHLWSIWSRFAVVGLVLLHSGFGPELEGTVEQFDVDQIEVIRLVVAHYTTALWLPGDDPEENLSMTDYPID